MVFADRTAYGEADLFTVLVNEHFRRFHGTRTEIGGGIVIGYFPVLGNAQYRPVIAGTVKIEVGNFQLAHGEGKDQSVSGLVCKR
ncbi:MAG: hypothetical protein CMM74_01600 [Rhodospirillaceae bacterium]|nr:hypothetical protein [Rhodospirillaceae bacterium]